MIDALLMRPISVGGPSGHKPGWKQMALEQKPRSTRKEYFDLLKYSVVGLEMGIAVGIGTGIGWYLDNKVFEGTRPWLTMIFLGFGIIAAAKAFYRTAKEMRAKVYGKEDEPQ